MGKGPDKTKRKRRTKDEIAADKAREQKSNNKEGRAASAVFARSGFTTNAGAPAGAPTAAASPRPGRVRSPSSALNLLSLTVPKRTGCQAGQVLCYVMLAVPETCARIMAEALGTANPAGGLAMKGLPHSYLSLGIYLGSGSYL